jgi:hypothetical protein
MPSLSTYTLDSTCKVSFLSVWHLSSKGSSFLQVLLLPLSSLKMLLEIGHYTCAITLSLFLLSNYPNSPQYLQYLDSLLLQCLPSLFSGAAKYYDYNSGPSTSLSPSTSVIWILHGFSSVGLSSAT